MNVGAFRQFLEYFIIVGALPPSGGSVAQGNIWTQKVAATLQRELCVETRVPYDRLGSFVGI